MDDTAPDLMGGEAVCSMAALLGTSDRRASGTFLVVVQRVEERHEKFMEWKSLGMIMGAVFIP